VVTPNLALSWISGANRPYATAPWWEYTRHSNRHRPSSSARQSRLSTLAEPNESPIHIRQGSSPDNHDIIYLITHIMPLYSDRNRTLFYHHYKNCVNTALYSVMLSFFWQKPSGADMNQGTHASWVRWLSRVPHTSRTDNHLIQHLFTLVP
jgi:hypothetical protein